MSKRITQDFFDEVVKENIDDFCMSQEEALKDAIQQFTSQGVELSNIDISGGIGRQELLDCINVIKYKNESTHDLKSVFDKLNDLCAENHEYSVRNNNIVYFNNLMVDIIRNFARELDKDTILAGFRLLENLSKNNSNF